MNLTIDELRSELRVINAAFIFAQIKENIAGTSKGKTQSSKIAKAFNAIDMDGSKELDIFEFADLVDLNYQEVSRMELDLLFKMIDTDRSQTVSLDELKIAFE